jgi:cell fate regulator YaaT (PSP1 superfamily)
MAAYHVIRVGALGGVQTVGAADSVRYPRGAEVIVRTPRGLEIAQVLDSPDESPRKETGFGSIVRAMTPQDRLLQTRLESNRHAAYQSCSARLAELGVSAALIDVEHLFDGQNLIFYFLGEVSPEVENYTQELAEAYEAQAQFRRFTDTLAAGCGPHCGTEEAGGGAGGCGSCATGCAFAEQCAPRG